MAAEDSGDLFNDILVVKTRTSSFKSSRDFAMPVQTDKYTGAKMFLSSGSKK